MRYKPFIPEFITHKMDCITVPKYYSIVPTIISILELDY